MIETSSGPETPMIDHFTARAERYDRSSHWCTDPVLADKIRDAVAAEADHRMLDVACGTGLVSRLFHGQVAHLCGVDLTEAMADQGRRHVDELILAPAEDLPLPDDSFDRVVCRQGIQFMDAPAAIRQMVRVTRPGGRIVLIHLMAYGPDDRDEYFEVLRLRNPARRNFFMPGDVATLLRDAGCVRTEEIEHISVEDVDRWSDHGAIDQARREAIRAVYRSGSEAFLRNHAVRTEDGGIVDHMLFGIAVGQV